LTSESVAVKAIEGGSDRKEQLPVKTPTPIAITTGKKLRLMATDQGRGRMPNGSAVGELKVDSEMLREWNGPARALSSTD
jgi:hypothetical protein